MIKIAMVPWMGKLSSSKMLKKTRWNKKLYGLILYDVFLSGHQSFREQTAGEEVFSWLCACQLSSKGTSSRSFSYQKGYRGTTAVTFRVLHTSTPSFF
jgi:hypothetical protein